MDENECYPCGEGPDEFEGMTEYFDGEQSRVAHGQCIVDAGLEMA